MKRQRQQQSGKSSSPKRAAPSAPPRPVHGAGASPGQAEFLRRAWDQGWPQGLLLIAALLIVYGPALNGGFLWDDDSWTTVIKRLLVDFKGLVAIWCDPTAMQQYYPLAGTTFWLDHQLWGPTWTLPYHVENVILHGIAAWLFWRLLRQLEVPGAGLAGLILAFHPMMVESVAWITERKNVLSLALFLGALLAYCRYTGAWRADTSEPRNRRAYWLALLLCLAALLSKTTTFSLPAVLLLICWWKRGTLRWRADVLPTLPFFAVAIGMSGATAWLEKHHVGAHGADWDFTFLQRCIAAGRIPWFYAGNIFWPAQLCFQYTHWHLDPRELMQWGWPVCGLLVVAGLWFARGTIGRGPLAAVLFFGGALFPVLGFMNAYAIKFSFVCDHWAYLPSLGLIALGAAAIALAAGRLQDRAALPIVATLLVGTLAWLAHGQSRDYANMETLWRATLERNPDSELAHNNLGYYLATHGQPEAAKLEYQKALEAKPNDPDALNNLGKACFDKGRIDEAIALLNRALELNPNDALAHDNLGAALFQTGRIDEAIGQFRRALDCQPNDASAHNNLGIALFRKGTVDEAIRHFQVALQDDGERKKAMSNLGLMAWLLATSPDAARRDGAKSLELAQELNQMTGDADPSFLSLLGAAYAETGHFPEAVAAVEKALRQAGPEANPGEIKELGQQLQAHQAGKPFREDTPR